MVERRLAELRPFEEVTGVERHGLIHATRTNVFLKIGDVDAESLRLTETEAVSVARYELVAECRAQAMQCLPESVSGFPPFYAAPKKVDDLVAARFTTDS
jgi:hypothetical protein